MKNGVNEAIENKKKLENSKTINIASTQISSPDYSMPTYKLKPRKYLQGSISISLVSKAKQMKNAKEYQVITHHNIFK